MNYNVISLKDTPKRLDNFYKNNPFMTDLVNVFSGIDGRYLSPQQIGEIKSDDKKMLPGEVGCALSHKYLWERVILIDESMTIFEDDVVLHPCFLEKSKEIFDDFSHKSLTYDFILWGWSYNSTLEFDFFNGLFPGAMINLDNVIRANINDILTMTNFQTLLVRLQKTFGLFAYTVSPMGAQKMLDKAFPIQDDIIKYIVGGKKVPIFGIDTQLNKIFKNMNAYACLPPLAYHTSGQGSIIRGKYLSEKI